MRPAQRADTDAPDMRQELDLDRYPLDQPAVPAYEALVQRCRAELLGDGMFNLERFVRQDTIRAAAAELAPLFRTSAWTHARDHNVYFLPRVEGVEDSHPALQKFKTINHTLCDDQILD